MIILPYNVDVPMQRWPVTNWVIMAATVVISFYAFGALLGDNDLERWMLSGSGDWWSDAGLLGSMFTHADIIHLLGNMMFLFVFGNAINAKLGHGLFLASYILLGVLSSIAFALATGDGTPSLGASGAISGITGMFIVFFPKNNVSVFVGGWFLVRFFWNSIEIPSWVVIGLYFAKDVLFQMLLTGSEQDSGIAFMAHISGTVFGAILAATLLLTRRITTPRYEETLLQMFGLRA